MCKYYATHSLVPKSQLGVGQVQSVLAVQVFTQFPAEPQVGVSGVLAQSALLVQATVQGGSPGFVQLTGRTVGQSGLRFTVLHR